MQIALRFNLPPQQDKVRVTFGEQNDDDEDRQFRVGVSKPDSRDALHWSLLGWVAGSEAGKLNRLELEVDRGDIVRVERKDKDGTATFFEVDTADAWPGGAYGNNEVMTTWGFED